MPSTHSKRLPVVKTHKLFIGGAFPRTESGRSIALRDRKDRLVAHLCRASRKDLRQAVEAARIAQSGWASATPYLRGQILHRLAEMLEGRSGELVEAIRVTSDRSARSARQEVGVAVDRVVSMAGWSDKLAMLLGGQNPVAGPYYTFTAPEPVGVVAVIDSSDAPLLGFISMIAPAIVSGSAVVAIASEQHPLPALLVAETAATADLPGGVLNLLTGEHEELLGHAASHRDIDAIIASVPERHAAVLREGSAENVKRVRLIDRHARFEDDEPWSGAGAFDELLEFKTIWHPIGA